MSYEFERRAWPRKDCLLPATFITSKKGKPFEGYVTDISADGLRLRSDRNFRNNAEIRVGFSLLGADLEICGSIQWRYENTVGLQFIRPVEGAAERNIFSFVNLP